MKVLTYLASSCFVALAAALLCSLDTAQAAASEESPQAFGMGFFVTSKGVDGSANLGGLDGADQHCQKLAEAVGAGDRHWRAYLSTSASGNTPGINARDRIGQGPWYNAKGVLIARDLGELHSDLHHIDRRTALDENAQRPQRAPHDVLTGSDESGRLAYVEGEPATCANWTASDNGVARIGHDDRMDADSHGNKRFRHWNGSWNSEHDTLGCAKQQLADTGGGGGFYCFAADAERALPLAPAPDSYTHTYTFKRGVNINHWLGDNIAKTEGFPARLYGETWFDEEDVAWIAAQGFDHLRVWVGGHNWITASGDVDEAAIVHFDNTLVWAKKHRLGVILAMHGLPGYRTGIRYGAPPTDVSSPFTDEASRADAAYLWWMVAKRYVQIGPQLRFELLASPSAESAQQIRRYNAETLAAIRRIDRRRMVYLTSRSMRVEHVEDVVFEDSNTALMLQMWEPVIFTRQFDQRIPQVKFPGKVPDIVALLGKDAPEARFSNMDLTVAGVESSIDAFVAKARAAAKGREIHVGLFGVIGSIDDDSARTFITTVRSTFERNQMGWTVYDYHTGGAVRADDGMGGPTRILDGLGLPKKSAVTPPGCTRSNLDQNDSPDC